MSPDYCAPCGAIFLFAISKISYLVANAPSSTTFLWRWCFQ